jgi:hypothetical protein
LYLPLPADAHADLLFQREDSERFFLPGLFRLLGEKTGHLTKGLFADIFQVRRRGNGLPRLSCQLKNPGFGFFAISFYTLPSMVYHYFDVAWNNGHSTKPLSQDATFPQKRWA